MGNIASLIERPQYESLDLSRINTELDNLRERLVTAEAALENERTKRKSYKVVNREHREELGKQSAQINRLIILEERLASAEAENKGLKEEVRRLVDENRKLQAPIGSRLTGRVSDTALQHHIMQILDDPHNEMKFISKYAQKKLYSVVFSEILSSLNALEMPIAGHIARIHLVPNRETDSSSIS